MRRVHNGWLGLTAALAFAVAGAACDNTARGVEQDANEAKEDAREAGAEARQEGREEAGDARRTAGEAGSAMDAAGETMDVKTALMADDNIEADEINVDTFHETKTVVLKGSVPTEAQKEAAGRVASREAEGYRVDNQLQVRPKS